MAVVRYPHDFSLSNDLAAKEPAKLKEMQALFESEAISHHVYPLDDRLLERTVPKLAGRPDLMEGRTSLALYSGMKGMSENVFLNLKNLSHTITADVEIPAGGANGVILAQAGQFGGWSLYLKDGKPTYCYNFLGLERYKIASTQPLPAGKANICFDFAYDGGGRGKGGMGTLLVNGSKVAEGRIARTQSQFLLGGRGGVGMDDATPVTKDYKERDNAFTGKILKITLDVKPVGAAVKAKADAVAKEAGVKKAVAN